MSLTKTINVTERVKTAKRETVRQRNAGYLPGVLYGHGIEPTPFSVKENEFIKTMHEVGATGFIELKSDNKNLNDKTTIVKNLQYHIIKDTITHIDLQLVKKGEELKVNVPVSIVGEAPGVKEGGLLQTATTEISISCKPKDMPKEFVVDISSLQIGDAITVKDLVVPSGVKVLDNEDELIVSVMLAKEMKVEADLEDTGVGVEAEEGSEATSSTSDDTAAENTADAEKTE